MPGYFLGLAGFSGAVPTEMVSMNLSGERQSLSEYSSYLTDVRRQMNGASGALISQFQSQLESTVLQPLSRMPEVQRQTASPLPGHAQRN